jgi:hypothetical protein
VEVIGKTVDEDDTIDGSSMDEEKAKIPPQGRDKVLKKV